MVRPRIDAASQTERLVAEMGKRAITHGQTVRADLARLRVSSSVSGMPLLYFCNVREIEIREMIEVGDGKPLPDEVAIEGFEVEQDGIYDIRNALISSNGRISVRVDERSRVELSTTG
ncbi:MAG TPA: hypothetical protein VGI97_08770 [Gemmatimonadaceae bacterium]|jgi:hypothetical protein